MPTRVEAVQLRLLEGFLRELWVRFAQLRTSDSYVVVQTTLSSPEVLTYDWINPGAGQHSKFVGFRLLRNECSTRAGVPRQQVPGVAF